MRIKILYLEIEVRSPSKAINNQPSERHWLATVGIYAAQRVAATGAIYLAHELIRWLNL